MKVVKSRECSSECSLLVPYKFSPMGYQLNAKTTETYKLT